MNSSFRLFFLSQFALLVAACLAPVAFAQNIVGGKFGDTPKPKSPPKWSSPGAAAVAQLGKVARDWERGIFVVGTSDGGHGTAWVISKKHRLLVTNAHVGDIYFASGKKMFGIPSGSTQQYAVENVWYHPGVRRYSNRIGRSIRSNDPSEGDVDPRSPDLAILQFSKEGPDLEVEFPLATAAELKELFAQSTAIMGFPGHDTKGFPEDGEKAAATFHEGVVSRITGFQMETSPPHEELQCVQYTMATWPGFSGSPVFLPNGHVVAIHNMAPPQTGVFKQIITIPHGIRSDSVLEMFVHHGLENLLPTKFDKSKVLVERWNQPDPQTEKALAEFARASALLTEAEHEIYTTYDYLKGVEKCHQALAIMPNLARAYYLRSVARNSWYVTHGGKSKEADVAILKLSHEDSLKYNEMCPSDARGLIHVCRVLNSFGVASGVEDNIQRAVKMLTELLNDKNLADPERASAHSLRATAVSNLGDKEAALRDHNEAIRLAPGSSIFWWNRSNFYKAIGRDDLAAADIAKAKELDAADAAPSLADDRAKAKQLRQKIVQVEWQGKWYEAAIMQTSGNKSQVHYLGYGASWDEWVTRDRIKATKEVER